jgi:hypothetical protein
MQFTGGGLDTIVAPRRAAVHRRYEDGRLKAMTGSYRAPARVWAPVCMLILKC